MAGAVTVWLYAAMKQYFFGCLKFQDDSSFLNINDAGYVPLTSITVYLQVRKQGHLISEDD